MTNMQLLPRAEVPPALRGRSASLPVIDAVTVRPDEPIDRAARLLIRTRLSALPVVDARGRLVGLMSESDLLTRLTSRPRSRWAAMWADNADLITEYRRVAGTRVADVMGAPPVPVRAGASLETAATLLARQGLRELPVVDRDRVIGIVTRADLLALLDFPEAPTGYASDAELVAEMRTRLRQEPWVTNRDLWVDARAGVLFLAGLVESEGERAALGIMARAIPGCIGVENETFPRTALRAHCRV